MLEFTHQVHWIKPVSCRNPSNELQPGPANQRLKGSANISHHEGLQRHGETLRGRPVAIYNLLPRYLLTTVQPDRYFVHRWSADSWLENKEQSAVWLTLVDRDQATIHLGHEALWDIWKRFDIELCDANQHLPPSTWSKFEAYSWCCCSGTSVSFRLAQHALAGEHRVSL